MSGDTGGSIGYFEAQAIRTIVREEIEKALVKIMRRPTKRPPDRAKSAVKKSSSTTTRKSTRRGAGNAVPLARSIANEFPSNP